eukprot:SAG22_NODE_17792_length_298_cov_0.839196_1_plen_86_part_10
MASHLHYVASAINCSYVLSAAVQSTCMSMTIDGIDVPFTVPNGVPQTAALEATPAVIQLEQPLISEETTAIDAESDLGSSTAPEER